MAHGGQSVINALTPIDQMTGADPPAHSSGPDGQNRSPGASPRVNAVRQSVPG
jgi:hypothetical protein